jgi:hypothetical protein
VPDRADWKAVANSKDEEIQMVETFRQKFNKFDFTQTEDD